MMLNDQGSTAKLFDRTSQKANCEGRQRELQGDDLAGLQANAFNGAETLDPLQDTTVLLMVGLANAALPAVKFPTDRVSTQVSPGSYMAVVAR